MPQAKISENRDHTPNAEEGAQARNVQNTAEIGRMIEASLRDALEVTVPTNHPMANPTKGTRIPAVMTGMNHNTPPTNATTNPAATPRTTHDPVDGMASPPNCGGFREAEGDRTGAAGASSSGAGVTAIPGACRPMNSLSGYHSETPSCQTKAPAGKASAPKM